MKAPRLEFSDPGRFALKSAARAAIVMPLVFAFADKVIQDPQTATFAAFGSFAILVLVDFGGPPASRLKAYLSLAAAGSVLITVGTLCSRNVWLAAGAMAAVGFLVLFSSVINGYFAAATTGALLTFILPVSLPAPIGVVGARLAGWGLACGAGIFAAMVVWPARPPSRIRAAAAQACRTFAELLDAELTGATEVLGERADAARDALEALRESFLGTPYRPTGPTGRTAALAMLIDELDWFSSFVLQTDAAHVREMSLCGKENDDALSAVRAALRSSAARLEGQDSSPDLDGLGRARQAVAAAVGRRLRELSPADRDPVVSIGLEPSFRARAMAHTARQIGMETLIATGAGNTASSATRSVQTRQALGAAERSAAEQVRLRSVALRNSVRGAAGLGIAVFVSQKTGVQHAFWVVLGTLSVLRSNALGTGASVLRALAGTGLGIALGAALILVVGTNHTALWVVLPVAVLIATYAPRAISFTAGQAGFTVVIFVLFNIIQPVGSKVGVVRIEDVAIGCAISLGVGVLFWPRGAAALLRQSLAAAYEGGADFAAAASRRLVEGGDPAIVIHSGAQATAAANRLELALRQYLTERSADRAIQQSLLTLVAGAGRLRRTADELSTLPGVSAGSSLDGACADALDRDIDSVRAWYMTLALHLVNAAPRPEAEARSLADRARVLRCVRESLSRGDEAYLHPAMALLWASQYLDNLRRLESKVARSAAELSGGNPVDVA
jgi:uncharacterized membrane protein YccC